MRILHTHFRHIKYFHNLYVLNLGHFCYISFTFASLIYVNYDMNAISKLRDINRRIKKITELMCHLQFML